MGEQKHYLAAPGVLHRAEQPTLPDPARAASVRAMAIVASLKRDPFDVAQGKALDTLIDDSRHEKADGTITPAVYAALLDLRLKRQWWVESTAALAKLGV